MADQIPREVRCRKCNRLLFKALGEYLVEILCKCKELQVLKSSNYRNIEKATP